MVNTPTPTLPSTNRRRSHLLAISTVVLVIGVALVAMMVVTEGEPGALPLALVLLGLVGVTVARVRSRSLRR